MSGVFPLNIPRVSNLTRSHMCPSSGEPEKNILIATEKKEKWIKLYDEKCELKLQINFSFFFLLYALFKALSFPSPRAPPTTFSSRNPKKTDKRESWAGRRHAVEMLTWPRGRTEKTGEIFLHKYSGSKRKNHRKQCENRLCKTCEVRDNYWAFSISKFHHVEASSRKVTISTARTFPICVVCSACGSPFFGGAKRGKEFINWGNSR